MNRATVLGLEQPITLELEAAQHEHHRRGPHRIIPIDGTLPSHSWASVLGESGAISSCLRPGTIDSQE